MKGVFVFLLRTQRAAAPVWRSLIGASGPCCRFHPTCSVYAEEAMVRHGLWRGLGMALHRLVRCHPWGGAGWDPVEKGSS